MRTCRDCPTVLPPASKRRLYCDTCRTTRKRAQEVEANRRYRLAHGRPPQRDQQLRRKYGMTEEDYQTLLAQQEGHCALGCGFPATRIDHCHDTGKVRGLLCHRCNVRLSGVEDGDFLARALQYLERAEVMT